MFLENSGRHLPLLKLSDQGIILQNPGRAGTKRGGAATASKEEECAEGAGGSLFEPSNLLTIPWTRSQSTKNPGIQSLRGMGVGGRQTP